MTSQCDLCAYYWIDEEDGTGECQVNLDEDDLARMLSGSADSCPYFQMYDEYKICLLYTSALESRWDARKTLMLSYGMKKIFQKNTEQINY